MDRFWHTADLSRRCSIPSVLGRLADALGASASFHASAPVSALWSEDYADYVLHLAELRGVKVVGDLDVSMGRSGDFECEPCARGAVAAAVVKGPFGGFDTLHGWRATLCAWNLQPVIASKAAFLVDSIHRSPWEVAGRVAGGAFRGGAPTGQLAPSTLSDPKTWPS
jgi:hypothetical protein